MYIGDLNLKIVIVLENCCIMSWIWNFLEYMLENNVVGGSSLCNIRFVY